MTSAERKEAISAYFFLSPFLFWMVFLMGGPILAAFLLSFCKWDIFNPIQFVGLQNYSEMFFDDPRFWKSLYNTAYFTIVSVPIGMILSIVVALLMNQKIKGIAIFRTIYYLPSILGSGVAMAVLWKWIFNADSGLLNYMIDLLTFHHIHIDQNAVGLHCPKWLASEAWSKPALIIMSFWNVGGGMIIYLAGLQGIPTALYEAAEIDGANRWQQLWTVTLPGLSPVIFFQLIVSIVGSFQIFNQVYVMTDGLGGPADSTLVMVLYIYQKFKYLQMGYASALAFVLFIVIMLATWMQFKFAKWVYYEGELRK
ncbi:MAG TPA: sugar ABC transporter permease [bacterium]|nr:sugar ABC transporter permease [bacterium]